MINVLKIGFIFFLLISCSSRKEQSVEERYGKWDAEQLRRLKDSAAREILKADSSFWDDVLKKK